MGACLIYLGLLFIAGIFDIKSLNIPNPISYTLMFGPLFLLWIHSDFSNLNIELKSILLVMTLTIPGFIKGLFGAADIKILLGLASIFPFTVMSLHILLTLVIFIAYSNFIFRKQNEVPFVPAIFISTSVLGLTVMVA